MRDILERQDKFDVDDRFVLPELGDIVVNGEVDHDTIDVTNVYYDTTDHDLQAHGIVLRRREGDDEPGWQLEIPDSGERTELHWVPSDEPPAEATDLLTGLTHGKSVDSVAKIHTVRERYRISSPESGRQRAELDDDRVRASVGERMLAWRQIEVESGAGARSVTRRLARRLRAAGARPSRYSSKLAHVSPTEPAPGSLSPAAQAVVDYLNTQIDQIVAGDIGLAVGRTPYTTLAWRSGAYAAHCGYLARSSIARRSAIWTANSDGSRDCWATCAIARSNNAGSSRRSTASPKNSSWVRLTHGFATTWRPSGSRHVAK